MAALGPQCVRFIIAVLIVLGVAYLSVNHSEPTLGPLRMRLSTLEVDPNRTVVFELISNQSVANMSLLTAADLLPAPEDSPAFAPSGYNIGDLVNMPVFKIGDKWDVQKQRSRHAAFAEHMPASVVGRYFGRWEVSTPGAENRFDRNVYFAYRKLACESSCVPEPDTTRLRRAMLQYEWGKRLGPAALEVLQDASTLVVHLRSGDRSTGNPARISSYAKEVVEVSQQLQISRIVLFTRLHNTYVYKAKEGSVHDTKNELIFFQSELEHYGLRVEFWRGSRRTDDDLLMMSEARNLMVHDGGFSAVAALLCRGTVHFSAAMAKFTVKPAFMMQINRIGVTFGRSNLQLSLDRGLSYTPSCCNFSEIGPFWCATSLHAFDCWVLALDVSGPFRQMKDSMDALGCRLVTANYTNVLDVYADELIGSGTSPRVLHIGKSDLSKVRTLIMPKATRANGRFFVAVPQQVSAYLSFRAEDDVLFMLELAQLLQDHQYALVRREHFDVPVLFVKRSLLPAP
mmetsp:Transcript_7928/g.18393  ORF Transcript_7928/g.18393 Transcript_7928/m.18393 type:complete len:513 (-) Transcript_7928:33-1571(-)